MNAVRIEDKYHVNRLPLINSNHFNSYQELLYDAGFTGRLIHISGAIVVIGSGDVAVVIHIVTSSRKRMRSGTVNAIT